MDPERPSNIQYHRANKYINLVVRRCIDSKYLQIKKVTIVLAVVLLDRYDSKSLPLLTQMYHSLAIKGLSNLERHQIH